MHLTQHSSSPTENIHKYINVRTQDICTQPDLFSCIFETPREGTRAGISNRDQLVVTVNTAKLFFFTFACSQNYARHCRIITENDGAEIMEAVVQEDRDSFVPGRDIQRGSRREILSAAGSR